MNSRFHDPIPANILKGIVPTLTNTDWLGTLSHAFQDDGGVFTDYTTEANNDTAGDVPMIPAVEVVNDAFYIGDANAIFNQISLTLSQIKIGNMIAAEYWNGAWVALSSYVTNDGTALFTQSGIISFTVPGDWVKTTVNGQNDYWIRLRVSVASITQAPIATRIKIGLIPTNLERCGDGDYSLKTGAGGCRLASAGTCGIMYIDMGSVKTISISFKAGLSSTANTMSISCASSDDDITYSEDQNDSKAITSTSELISYGLGIILRGRYIRVKLLIDGAGAGYMYVYEFMAWEVGA